MDKKENLVREFLSLLGEDPEREGLLDTPKRVSKAFDFLTSGYKEDPKEVLGSALFTSSASEMVLIKDIEFYSLCEHHLLPIIGKAHVAYIPNGKVNIFARRLQIQEQMTEQIASALQDCLAPKGVGVMIEARHMCMEMRGVQKINSITSTSALRGIFIKDERTRKEFFDLIKIR